MKKRNNFIDIAKGIAILMVVITHYKWSGSQRIDLLFPYHISMAVPIFMLVTGYVSAASFLKNGVTTLKNAYAIKPMAKKLLRYTLPFLYMYITQNIIALAMGEGISPLEVLMYFFGGGRGEYGTYYYPVLIQIVLIFPIVFIAVSRFKYGILGCFLANLAYELLKNAVDMSGGAYRLIGLRYIFAVAMGCYIYLHRADLKGKKSVILCALGALYIWLVNYTSYEPRIFTFWTATSMLAVLFIAPIFAAGLEWGKDWHFPPIELLGKASYHIFLAQIIYYNYIAPLIYDAVKNKLLQLLISVTISLSLGIAYYFSYNKIKSMCNKSTC